MAFTTAHIENRVARTFASQLEADLATGVRGGNKYRLIARCWVAAGYGAECGLAADQYDRFRAQWERQTFAAIHQAFDHLLPVQFRAAGARASAPAAPAAKPRNTKAWEKFQGAPARVAKEMALSLKAWGTSHPSAASWQAMADAALAVTPEQLEAFYEQGARTAWDLTYKLNRLHGLDV